MLSDTEREIYRKIVQCIGRAWDTSDGELEAIRENVLSPNEKYTLLGVFFYDSIKWLADWVAYAKAFTTIGEFVDFYLLNRI